MLHKALILTDIRVLLVFITATRQGLLQPHIFLHLLIPLLHELPHNLQVHSALLLLLDPVQLQLLLFFLCLFLQLSFVK